MYAGVAGDAGAMSADDEGVSYCSVMSGNDASAEELMVSVMDGGTIRHPSVVNDSGYAAAVARNRYREEEWSVMIRSI